MLNPVRRLPASSTHRTTSLIAALALSLPAFVACDSSDKNAGVTQDATSAPDLGADSATATSPADTAEDTTAAADTARPADSATAADTTAADTTAADTATAADTTAADTTTADTATPPEDTATADTGVPDVTLPTDRPAVVATSMVSIGDWQMDPGKEVTKCVVKRLDNADPLWISAIHTQLNDGSHHMIIYKSDDAQERPDPFNCDPFVQVIKGGTYPLMITQLRQETLSFPNGVAFRFEPHQMVRLEAHYLNYYPDKTITAHGDVTFDGIAEKDVVAEANILFYGDPDLQIPEGDYSTPWRYISVLPNTHVFAITGHTHAYGTNVEISDSTSVDDPGTSIYPGDVPFSWSDPPVESFDPALAFDGDTGFRFRCSWDNTSGAELRFGESAKKEMCFLWAYYYPSQGYRLCITPGSIGGGVAGPEVCCPGSWVCDYIQQFL